MICCFVTNVSRAYGTRARAHTQKESIELKIWIVFSRNILELSKS